MDLHQIVAEADAQKAFVSNQSLYKIKAEIDHHSGYLEVAQALSSHADQIAELALREGMKESASLTELPKVLLRYLSYRLLIDTEKFPLLEECLFGLKAVSVSLELPMPRVAVILLSLKQAVIAFIHNLASKNQYRSSKSNFSEIAIEVARYCDRVIADLNESASVREPLWKNLVDIGSQVPDEAWAKLPTDLSRNFEHYMYGAPKDT